MHTPWLLMYMPDSSQETNRSHGIALITVFNCDAVQYILLHCNTLKNQGAFFHTISRSAALITLSGNLWLAILAHVYANRSFYTVLTIVINCTLSAFNTFKLMLTPLKTNNSFQFKNSFSCSLIALISEKRFETSLIFLAEAAHFGTNTKSIDILQAYRR